MKGGKLVAISPDQELKCDRISTGNRRAESMHVRSWVDMQPDLIAKMAQWRKKHPIATIHNMTHVVEEFSHTVYFWYTETGK